MTLCKHRVAWEVLHIVSTNFFPFWIVISSICFAQLCTILKLLHEVQVSSFDTSDLRLYLETRRRWRLLKMPNIRNSTKCVFVFRVDVIIIIINIGKCLEATSLSKQSSFPFIIVKRLEKDVRSLVASLSGVDSNVERLQAQVLRISHCSPPTILSSDWDSETGLRGGKRGSE